MWQYIRLTCLKIVIFQLENITLSQYSRYPQSYSIFTYIFSVYLIYKYFIVYKFVIVYM